MATPTYDELKVQNEALLDLLAAISEARTPFAANPDDSDKQRHLDGRRLDQISIYADVRSFADASYIRDSAKILRESWARPLGYEPKAEAA